MLKSKLARVATALTLGVALSVVSFPAANATGYTNRSCSTWGLGSGNVDGFSGTAYGYTQKNGSCAAGITVQVRYQVYPGGPYAWTSQKSGITFARIDQTMTIGAEHCLAGVACWQS